MRCHLSFSYTNPERGHVNTGSQVVEAETIEAAARKIADERGVRELHVKSRYHMSGQVDTIETTFRFDDASDYHAERFFKAEALYR